MRQLPAVWSHRTNARSWVGPLDGEDGARTAPARDWRRGLHVLRVLTRSDFRARYRAQALGVVWSLLNPLVMMGILSVVFTRVFRDHLPHYPVFVLVGLIVWQWIGSSLSAATQVFVHHADVVKRTVFAREILPVASVLSYGINFAVESLVLLAFVAIDPDAFRLSPALLLVPLLVALLAALLAGVALATSVLNVVYRDVAYLVNTALLLGYWLTPIIYPPEKLPAAMGAVLAWNPFGAILTALRGALMNGSFPSAIGWATILVPTALVLALGYAIFRRYEGMALDYA